MRKLNIVNSTRSFLPQLGIQTNVVELTHYKMLYVYHRLQNSSELYLQREEHHIFDKNAVEVYFEGQKIGYISNKVNSIVARHMDAGKLVLAKVKRIKRNKAMPLSELDIEVVIM